MQPRSFVGSPSYHNAVTMHVDSMQMYYIKVTVQSSGRQAQIINFRVPSSGAPWDVVVARLNQQFGPGSFHEAGSTDELLPQRDVYLHPGDYEYRLFAGRHNSPACCARKSCDV